MSDSYAPVRCTWYRDVPTGPDTAVHRFPNPTLSELGPLTFVSADAGVVLRLSPDGTAELVDVSELPDDPTC